MEKQDRGGALGYPNIKGNDLSSQLNTGITVRALNITDVWVLLGEISDLIGLEYSLDCRNFKSSPAILMFIQGGGPLTDRGGRCNKGDLGRRK